MEINQAMDLTSYSVLLLKKRICFQSGSNASELLLGEEVNTFFARLSFIENEAKSVNN